MPPPHWDQLGFHMASWGQLGLAITPRGTGADRPWLLFSCSRCLTPHGCLTCPSAGGLAWRSLILAHHTISKDLGSAEGGSFIQTSLQWHPSPIWVPPVTSGSWVELGSRMAEDGSGANGVWECCEALMAGRSGFAWAPQPLLNYLWSDQVLQGSRAHRQSCLVGLQRHHVCWANKAFFAQGCACVP